MRSSVRIAVTALNEVSTGSLVWRQGAACWATLVVKATFRLVNGAGAELCDPLDLVEAEQPRRPGGSLEAADEVVPHLVNAGVVLSGSACAPAGQTVPSLAVRLGLSSDRKLIDKTLHIFGDKPSAAAASQPFDRLPIVWERAYGGPSIADNPVGTGAAPGSLPPTILDPIDPRRPAGLGAVARTWPLRRHWFSGEPSALDGPSPEIPENIDWRYFNPAPLDQQIDALLGNEWIILDGLHPASPRVQTRLPSVTARVECHSSTAPPRAVDMRADLLVIDAGRQLCSLVWRGRIALDHLDQAREITAVAGVELPGRPIPAPAHAAAPTGASLAATGALDLRAMMPSILPFSKKDPLPATPPLEAPVAPKPRLFSGTLDFDVRKVLAEAVPFKGPASAPVAIPPATPRAAPNSAPPSPAPVIEPPPPEALTTPAEPSPNEPRSALPFAPADRSRPSPASIPGKPVTRAPKEFSGTGGLDIRQLLKPAVPFAGAPAPEPAIHLTPPEPAAMMDAGQSAQQAPSPTPPVAVEAPARAPSEREAPPEDEDDSEGAIDVRAAVIAQIEARGTLLGLDLVNADLHGLDLTGMLLSGLDLRRANLRGARCAGVRLTGADLGRADLTDAVFSGANLSRANVAGATMTGAQLDGAILLDTNLSSVDASQANFGGADLRRAKLAGAKLLGARFGGADLRAADLTGASVDEPTLRDARRGAKNRNAGSPGNGG